MRDGGGMGWLCSGSVRAAGYWGAVAAVLLGSGVLGGAGGGPSPSTSPSQQQPAPSSSQEQPAASSTQQQPAAARSSMVPHWLKPDTVRAVSQPWLQHYTARVSCQAAACATKSKRPETLFVVHGGTRASPTTEGHRALPNPSSPARPDPSDREE